MAIAVRCCASDDCSHMDRVADRGERSRCEQPANNYSRIKTCSRLSHHRQGRSCWPRPEGRHHESVRTNGWSNGSQHRMQCSPRKTRYAIELAARISTTWRCPTWGSASPTSTTSSLILERPRRVQQRARRGGGCGRSAPAVQGNAETGKDLFTGVVRFQNGGPPCMACHSTGGIGALGGGSLGPT